MVAIGTIIVILSISIKFTVPGLKVYGWDVGLAGVEGSCSLDLCCTAC